MVWRCCGIQCITFCSLISHIDHWCYPSCRWYLGQGEPGELFFPFEWEGHQCTLRAHWYWYCHYSLGHLWLFCYLPSFCMDAKTGESLFSLELILDFRKVLHVVGFVSWNWPWPFMISPLSSQVTFLLSVPTSVVFSLSFLIKTCSTDWADYFFFVDSPCSCDVSYLFWLGLSFYPTVCYVSDSHFFGWTGRCHRRICFQTWGKPEFGNLNMLKLILPEIKTVNHSEITFKAYFSNGSWQWWLSCKNSSPLLI